MYCSNCGTQLNELVKYCYKCGSTIDSNVVNRVTRHEAIDALKEAGRLIKEGKEIIEAPNKEFENELKRIRKEESEALTKEAISRFSGKEQTAWIFGLFSCFPLFYFLGFWYGLVALIASLTYYLFLGFKYQRQIISERSNPK